MSKSFGTFLAIYFFSGIFFTILSAFLYGWNIFAVLTPSYIPYIIFWPVKVIPFLSNVLQLFFP